MPTADPRPCDRERAGADLLHRLNLHTDALEAIAELIRGYSEAHGSGSIGAGPFRQLVASLIRTQADAAERLAGDLDDLQLAERAAVRAQRGGVR